MNTMLVDTWRNCASGNRALNFLGNFREYSESFLESVRVGTFLVFSRKFPKKCASRYVLPFVVLLKGQLISKGLFGVFNSSKKWTKTSPSELPVSFLEEFRILTSPFETICPLVATFSYLLYKHSWMFDEPYFPCFH